MEFRKTTKKLDASWFYNDDDTESTKIADEIDIDKQPGILKERVIFRLAGKYVF